MSDKTLKDDVIREFDGGATRDSAKGKLDYEGFLSPVALEIYAQYMDKHRVQSDGNLRDSDNWQSGFGLSVVLKSAWRHLVSWWKIHRGIDVFDERDGSLVTVQDAVCGVIFNAFCYLHEIDRESELTKNAYPFDMNRAEFETMIALQNKMSGVDASYFHSEIMKEDKGDIS